MKGSKWWSVRIVTDSRITLQRNFGARGDLANFVLNVLSFDFTIQVTFTCSKLAIETMVSF